MGSTLSTRDVPFWNPEQDDTLICRQVRDETHDVRTFVFAAKEPRRFAYAPGQFLTLSLDCGPIGSGEINRCYTLSSSPTRPDLVAITVKRVEKGLVSNWLHDNLEPGMEVRVTGPMGDFTCEGVEARKYLFLSGGSGITPMMAMSRTFHDLGGTQDIVFLHSARSPQDLIFSRELALLEQNSPGFRTVTICEKDSPEQRWNGFRGRLSPEILSLAVPDFMEREIFVCGPDPYMTAVRTMLKNARFDMQHHHEESFDFSTFMEAELEDTFPPAEDAEKTYAVSFTKSRRDITCGAETSILSAARAAGMRLPSSCAKGMCGTCKCKLISGTVEMKHEGGIRQREIDQGLILICCAKPTSDVVVER